MNIKSGLGLVMIVVGLLLSPVGAYADSIIPSFTIDPYIVSQTSQAIDDGISITATSVSTVKVQITNGFNASEDSFAFNNVPGLVLSSASINANGDIATFTGTGTVAQFEQLLRNIAYKNSNVSPATMSRTFLFSLGTSPPASAATSVSVTKPMRFLVIRGMSTAGGTISPSGDTDTVAFTTPTYTMTPDAGFYLEDIIFSDFAGNSASLSSLGLMENPFTFPSVLVNGDRILHAVFEPFATITTSGASGVYIRGTTPHVVDSGVVVSAGTITAAKVSIGTGFDSGEDVLTFTPTGGITGSYDVSKGILSLTGLGTAAEYQAVFRSVLFSNASASKVPQKLQVSFSLGDLNVNPDNGHFYEVIDKGESISWTDANTESARHYYFGIQGYLATIRSEPENAVIKNILSTTAWMGASDVAVEGVWRWATGPETGAHFFGAAITGNCRNNLGGVVDGYYINWSGGEPNSCNEDHATITSQGSWNDVRDDAGQVDSYVVEYGGMGGDPPHTLIATTDFDVTNYHVTASSGANGSITDQGLTTFFVTGSSPVYTITPDANFQVADVIVDGVSQGAVSGFVFSNIDDDHTISVTFERIVHTITATLSGDGQGTISSPGATTYRQAIDSASYTIASDSNMFFITDVIVDGVSQGQIDFFDFGPVMAPHTIEAVISTRPQLDSNFFGTGF
ncbi:hypothetical protein HOH87_00625 [bacterium]|jgi:hypothetical protein|nr:hypothetical protein [bacterium]